MENENDKGEQNLKLLLAGGLQILVEMDKEIKSPKYGKMYRAFNRNNHKQYYYVKMIYKGDPQHQELIKNELEISKLLRNGSSVLIYIPNMFSSKGNIYLISEYWERTLEEEMKQKQYSEKEIFQIFVELMCGYKELFENKLLHQNISPANIFIQNGKYMIGGFEYSVFYQTHTFDQNKVGEAKYMSPEKLVLKIYQGNPKSDIYALGIIMYQIISKTHPYIKGEDQLNICLKESKREFIDKLKQVQAIDLKSNDKSSQFNKLASMIMKMISKSQPKRSSFQEVWQFIRLNEFLSSLKVQPKSKGSLFQSNDSLTQQNKFHKNVLIKSAFYLSLEERQKINQSILKYIQKNRFTIWKLNNLINALKSFETNPKNQESHSLIMKLSMFMKYQNQKVIKEMETFRVFKENQWFLFMDSENASVIKTILEYQSHIEQLIKSSITQQNQLDYQVADTYFRLNNSQKEKKRVVIKSFESLLEETCLLIQTSRGMLKFILFLIYAIEYLSNLNEEKQNKSQNAWEDLEIKLGNMTVQDMINMVAEQCQKRSFVFSFDG